MSEYKSPYKVGDKVIVNCPAVTNRCRGKVAKIVKLGPRGYSTKVCFDDETFQWANERYFLLLTPLMKELM